MNGRVWGLKLSLFIRHWIVINELTCRLFAEVNLFRQIIVPVWS